MADAAGRSDGILGLNGISGVLVRELTYLGPRRVEWRSVAEPRLEGPREALVRPVIAGRCDGDNLPIFNRVTTAMRAGVALHYLDPLSPELLGPYPFKGPFAIGHECIASVIECGDEVRMVRPGDLVVVPWSISCGGCSRCADGITSRCVNAGSTLLSGYGFGSAMGPWGGTVCDLLRVPFADAMLVPIPASIDPLRLASASDNLTDAWRCVAPQLAVHPGAPVIVIGGGARSIGLYAAGLAVALASARVTYVDYHPERLAIAERLGASLVKSDPGSRWFNRHAPRIHGDYPIAVEASSTVGGLQFALRSMCPGGTCTAVGYYFARNSGLPLLQMYANSATLQIGLSNVRAFLPAVIEFLASGQFDPMPVATLVADWDDAPSAFTTQTTKVIVRRSSVR